MAYIKLIDGAPAPYSFRQLRMDNPNVSFPKEVSDEWLSDYNVFPLSDTPPSVTDMQVMDTGAIERVKGVWTQAYSVRDKTPSEINSEIADKANSIETGSARDKAMFLLFVDMWRETNPGMTQQEARAAVRERLRVHLTK